MSIRVNSRELLEILEITPPSQNILVAGKHGIGKSEIVRAHYESKGLRVVALFLGQMSDPGDLIGLPRKNEATGRTEFLPPWWWPAPDAPVALFLDELNRARPELLQSIFDLALNRVLAGRPLPPGSVVVSAINVGDEYQVIDLDPALLSRFNVYEFVPETDEWLAWARRHKLDARVIGFIESHMATLDTARGQSDSSIAKTPDRRGWSRVSQLIASHKSPPAIVIKAIAGIVGAQAAVEFQRYLTQETRLSPDQVLGDWSPELEAKLGALELPDVIALSRQIVFRVDERAAKATPAKKAELVAAVERYIAYLTQQKRGEAIADFVNLVERGEAARATALLLGTPKFLTLMENYIQGVRI